MADIMLFDPTIPVISTANGQELLAACQGNDNKVVTFDFLKSFIKPYKEYGAKLWQASITNFLRATPFIDEITNGKPSTDPDYLAVTFSRLDVGKFEVKVRYKSPNYIYPDKVDLYFSDGKVRVTGSTSGGDGTSNYVQYTFSSYNISNVEADGVLNSLTNMYIRLYN